MWEFFLHYFTPHHTNNHRARVLHSDVLVFYLVLLAVFRLGIHTFHTNVSEVLGYATDIHVEALLSATNSQRQGHGLGPLSLNQQLSAAAAQKAQNMFAENYWAHNSPSGRTPWTFIVASGYKYLVAGENLAKNFSNSQGVVDAWMASPSHRDNMLKPSYRDVGFAVVNGRLGGEETTLVVQMFGSMGAPVAAAPPAATPSRAPIAVISPASAPEPASGPAKPVEVTSIASVTGPASPTNPTLGSFVAAFRRPLIDIPSLTRSLVLISLGFFIGVLGLDAWLVWRRHTVRVSGHSFAHLLFFATIFLTTGSVLSGSIL